MRRAAGVDNEACLGWLEGALQGAFEQRKPQLWAYLEAVMDEVFFEIEAERSERTRMAGAPADALHPTA
jgi:hypothetical protein